MNELFNPENRFWNFMNKITDVFVLGILWFLFSIPVITAGAATTSLYQFTLKQADDEEGYVFKSFVRAFTKNFKQATILWLLVLAAAGFLAVDLWACMQIAIPSWVRVVCFGVLLCLSLIFALTALYLFPVLSRFHLPIKTILPHSFIMAMGNLYISVTVLVTYIIFGVLSFYIPILFPVFMALAAFISSYLFRYVFTRYQEDGEDQ
ncbi:MAG: DUF624 domain-containing protein [Hungatella sp.]|nr:DUF624 domain-containing protein [Hungatella sp.]